MSKKTSAFCAQRAAISQALVMWLVAFIVKLCSRPLRTAWVNGGKS